MNIILYWKFAVGAFGAFIITWAIHNHIIANLEEDHKKTLAAQIQFDINKCNDDKQITSEISHGLQNDLNALNDKLKRLRQQPAKCLHVTNPASRHDATASKGINAGSDEVAAGALIDYAGDAEKYRLQLVSCQGFVSKVWQTTQPK